MKIDPAVLAQVLSALDARVAAAEDDVVAILRQVASGEQELVETVTDSEREQVRALSATVAGGPVRAQLHRVVHQVAVGAVTPRVALALVSYVCFPEFHVPVEETAPYNIAGDAFGKLRWLYRHWMNQLEVAEPGSGLEAFFAAHRLELPLAANDAADQCPRVSISCAGDLLAVDVLTADHTDHLFDSIGDFYASADIVSANLESTVSDTLPCGRTQQLGQPARMNTSVAMLTRFARQGGINFMSTATNHALDWGADGVTETLQALDACGIRHAGTARTRAEQDTVTVVECHGIRIALLAYTFDLNGHRVPPGKEFLVNQVRFNDPEPDYALVERQVAAAHAAGADHVMAYCHWGWEFEHYPHLATVEAAHRLVAAGVDTILGNHAHVSQPAQLIPRSGRPPALVVYGFGDFVSYHPASRNSHLAYAVRFDVVKEAAGSTHLASLEALPLYLIHRHLADGSTDSRIVPFRHVLEDPDRWGLTAAARQELPHLKDIVWNRILAPLAQVEHQLRG